MPAFTDSGGAVPGTDPENRFMFDTVKPGSIGEGHAPHLNVVVFMRGLLSHAYTRIYFSDEAEANETDPVLAEVPAERRRTLIAEREETGEGVLYRFDIHMQGDHETVVFRCLTERSEWWAKFLSLSDAIEDALADGDTVAMEGFTHLIPHAAGHEVIRQGQQRPDAHPDDARHHL